MADLLKTNTTITSLDLEYNQLGPDGAKHLSEALKTNSALKELLCAAARPFLHCQ